MKCLVVVFCLYISVQSVYCAMSEAQMKAALKLVRNVCQPKAKATSEEIDGMRDGKWDLEKSGKCYLYCILNMYKLMGKDNSFDWEGGIKALQAQAPPALVETAAKSIVNCKDAVKTQSDKCTAAYEVAKCIYDDNPSNYFLP